MADGLISLTLSSLSHVQLSLCMGGGWICAVDFQCLLQWLYAGWKGCRQLCSTIRQYSFPITMESLALASSWLHQKSCQICDIWTACSTSALECDLWLCKAALGWNRGSDSKISPCGMDAMNKETSCRVTIGSGRPKDISDDHRIAMGHCCSLACQPNYCLGRFTYSVHVVTIHFYFGSSYTEPWDWGLIVLDRIHTCRWKRVLCWSGFDLCACLKLSMCLSVFRDWVLIAIEPAQDFQLTLGAERT